MFITNGSLQGFVFLLETLLEPGDLVAVEAPTYDRALLQLRLHGMDVLPIPVEDDGLDVDALAAACGSGRVPRLIYTIPNFQNPSGATISLEKRRALVEVCERHGILILEDDPYGKLRFEGEPIASIAELAPPGRVLFTSSFSKTVAPGLRVGLPGRAPEIAGPLAAAASRTYISPALLAEAAVHQLIASGGLPANIARVTELMRERRDAMVAGLGELPEGTRCVPPAGGFFIWLTLPDGPVRGRALRRGGRRGRGLRQGQRLLRRRRRAHAAPRLQRGQPRRDRRGHAPSGRRVPGSRRQLLGAAARLWAARAFHESRSRISQNG